MNQHHLPVVGHTRLEYSRTQLSNPGGTTNEESKLTMRGSSAHMVVIPQTESTWFPVWWMDDSGVSVRNRTQKGKKHNYKHHTWRFVIPRAYIVPVDNVVQDLAQILQCKNVKFAGILASDAANHSDIDCQSQYSLLQCCRWKCWGMSPKACHMCSCSWTVSLHRVPE